MIRDLGLERQRLATSARRQREDAHFALALVLAFPAAAALLILAGDVLFVLWAGAR